MVVARKRKTKMRVGFLLSPSLCRSPPSPSSFFSLSGFLYADNTETTTEGNLTFSNTGSDKVCPIT
jgi:hypothetical protein